MIDIFIPVLGRAEAIEPLVSNIHDTTSHDFRIVFICSLGDDEATDACIDTGELTMVVPWEAGFADYPRKMNQAYRHADDLEQAGEWMFMGATDIAFERNWDHEALLVAEQGYSVIATNDEGNRQVQRGLFGTHCLVGRGYIDEDGGSMDGPGVLFHEGYDHNFCDRELCGLATHRGAFMFAPRSKVIHHHPNWRKGKTDAVYDKGMANFKADFELFIIRSRQWGMAGLSSVEKSCLKRRRGRRR